MSIPATYFRYETNEEGTIHLWACIALDKRFAVHVWARKRTEEGHWERRDWYGGVEQHVSPTICDGRIDQDHCPLLGGECCHDGSSVAFDWEYSRVEEAIRSGRPSDIFPRVAHIFEQRWNMMQESKS